MNNNIIKIAARFNNLTAAVAATGMDLSYNERDARQTIRYMESDRSLKLVSVFADDSNQIWYVINSVRENLNLLHKFEPFFSCIHNGPFNVMMPKADGDIASLETAKELVPFTTISKTQENRKLIAKTGLIAA
jgi:hypothetical protein